MRFLTFTDTNSEKFFVAVEHITTVKFRCLPIEGGRKWEIIIISLRGEYLKTTTSVSSGTKLDIEQQLSALT